MGIVGVCEHVLIEGEMPNPPGLGFSRPGASIGWSDHGARIIEGSGRRHEGAHKCDQTQSVCSELWLAQQPSLHALIIDTALRAFMHLSFAIHGPSGSLRRPLPSFRLGSAPQRYHSPVSYRAGYHVQPVSSTSGP